MTWSMFVAHYVANRRHMPRAVATQILREAVDRLEGRFCEQRAGGMLDYTDLIERIENAVAGGMVS